MSRFGYQYAVRRTRACVYAVCIHTRVQASQGTADARNKDMATDGYKVRVWDSQGLHTQERAHREVHNAGLATFLSHLSSVISNASAGQG